LNSWNNWNAMFWLKKLTGSSLLAPSTLNTLLMYVMTNDGRMNDWCVKSLGVFDDFVRENELHSCIFQSKQIYYPTLNYCEYAESFFV
jgi:hypothetical protein